MRQPDDERTPSRTDRKRADRPVKDLARQLAELNEAACQTLPAPDDLKEEILAAIHTKAHGARKRQIKRLASLLRKRDQDADRLREALSRKTATHLSEIQAHKGLEVLRERICDPDQAETALEEALRLFPNLDRKNLQRLSKSARAAQESGDRRAYREIFRQLKRAREASEDGGATEAEIPQP